MINPKQYLNIFFNLKNTENTLKVKYIHLFTSRQNKFRYFQKIKFFFSNSLLFSSFVIKVVDVDRNASELFK